MPSPPMMKLSDTFRHRIVISNPGDILESVDACLAFLESLSLDPNAEQKLANIQYRLQQIEQKAGPSVEQEEKKTYFSVISSLSCSKLRR